MWNVTNSFIVNLSITDLLNSIFNCIFSFIFMKSRYVALFGMDFTTLSGFFTPEKKESNEILKKGRLENG